jgi:hypothetical protein
MEISEEKVEMIKNVRLIDAFKKLTLSDSDQPHFMTKEQELEANRRLCQALKNIPEPLNNMAKFLQDHSGVIAGSFLLRCIFDQRFVFPPGDIDIFFSARDMGVVYEALSKFGWKYTRDNQLRTIAGYLHIANIEHQYHMEKDGFIVNCIFFRGGSKSTQDTCEEIDRGFDLDGCTLKWTGKVWSLAPDVNFQDLLQGILVYRESCLKDCINTMSNRDPRSHKYGGLHPKTRNSTEWEKVLYQRIQSRMTKYKNRGFTISNEVRIYQTLLELLLH